MFSTTALPSPVTVGCVGKERPISPPLGTETLSMPDRVETHQFRLVSSIVRLVSNISIGHFDVGLLIR